MISHINNKQSLKQLFHSIYYTQIMFKTWLIWLKNLKQTDKHIKTDINREKVGHFEYP